MNDKYFVRRISRVIYILSVAFQSNIVVKHDYIRSEIIFETNVRESETSIMNRDVFAASISLKVIQVYFIYKIMQFN